MGTFYVSEFQLGSSWELEVTMNFKNYYTHKREKHIIKSFGIFFFHFLEIINIIKVAMKFARSNKM